MLTTEFDFTLPRGLVDDQGHRHQVGRMRLATARDELAVQKHPLVRQDPDYQPLVMLAQVIVQLGDLTPPTPQQLENLFSPDLAYLREFYNRVNQQGQATIPVACPQCQCEFQATLQLSGE